MCNMSENNFGSERTESMFMEGVLASLRFCKVIFAASLRTGYFHKSFFQAPVYI